LMRLDSISLCRRSRSAGGSVRRVVCGPAANHAGYATGRDHSSSFNNSSTRKSFSARRT
jgi:hypothetical protein